VLQLLNFAECELLTIFDRFMIVNRSFYCAMANIANFLNAFFHEELITLS